MRDRRDGDRPRQPKGKHRINEQITSRTVRLIGLNAEQLGVVSIEEALSRAEEDGHDLVEVAPDVDPPVCKILDYGKLRYREQKKAAEARKHSTTHGITELRVRYSTAQHDLDTKVRNARRFITEGDRVRFQMRFRGREVEYRDLGLEMFKQISTDLEDIAVVEEMTPLMGKRMTMTLVPKALAKTN